MQSGRPFTYEDLARWPRGAEKAEIYDGALLYSGQFTEEDAAAARRTYPNTSSNWTRRECGFSPRAPKASPASRSNP